MAKEFVIAKSVKEASAYLKNGAALLAGGTEINRLNSSVKADTLVSIGRLEGLDSVSKTSKHVKIGAMCTFQELAENSAVPEYLKKACLYMSSRTRRNMATIGGNIASLRDDSYLLATLLACDANLELLKAGKVSEVPLLDYVNNAKERAYMIVAVVIPCDNVSVDSKRYSNTASSHAVLTVAAAKKGKKIKVACCAKNSGIYCFDDFADLLKIKFKSDMYGSKEYKKYLLETTVVDLINKIKGEDK